MNNKKRFMLWSLLLVVTGSLGNPAYVLGDSDDHHQRESGESVPSALHKAWMRWLPDDVSLFAISIPATHDSITYTAPSGGLCETQLMDIVRQMNAGIRAFDIRASRQKIPDRLELWHGGCRLYRTLDDVLKNMVSFLQGHPTETLILRLGDDGISDGESDHDPTAESMQELFEQHRKRIVPRRHRHIDADKPLAPMTWAQRLRRVFAIDIESCPECGGRLSVIACTRHGLTTATEFHLTRWGPSPGTVAAACRVFGFPSGCPPPS